MSNEEDRAETRYTLLRRIEGALGKVDFVLCDIGDRGLLVQHASPIRLGTEAPMNFSVPDAGLSVHLRAIVVWSRFASPENTRPYRSGVRVNDPDGVLRQAIEKLRTARAIRLDEDSMARKKKALAEKVRARQAPRMRQTGHAPRIPDDVILLVKQVRQRLQANPSDLVRWFNRAKFSLNDAGDQIHERDDVLAVWEYLERSVELSVISRVLDE